MKNKKKLLVICGPTGSGKTDLGIKLARGFNGAIISADSRQVYRGLDWGTNKFGVSEEEMDPPRTKARGTPELHPAAGGMVLKEGFKGSNSSTVKSRGVLGSNMRERWVWDGQGKFWVKGGVRVYLYDTVNPGESYSVFDFIVKTKQICAFLWEEGKLPVVVGGTGFYIRGLMEGVGSGGVGADWVLRRELEKRSVKELQEILKMENKRLFNKMNNSDQNNPRRLVRKIEISKGKLEGISPIEADVLKIGLRGRRELLMERGDRWVEAVVREGLVSEVRRARERGWGKTEQLKGMIYGPVQEFLEGRWGKAEMERKIKQQVRGYIRRQLVWLAKEKGISWVDIEEKDWLVQVEKQVGEWYSKI